MRMNLVVKNEVSEYNKEAISNSRKKHPEIKSDLVTERP